MTVSVNPGAPTGVVPPLAGGIVIAALIVAGSWAAVDHGDQVSGGGVSRYMPRVGKHCWGVCPESPIHDAPAPLRTHDETICLGFI